MRGSKLQGRFNVDYESKSMYEGIAEELGGTVGVNVEWFRWQEYYLEDHYRQIVDETYDVSSQEVGKGLRWMLPFTMPVIMAQAIRGTNVMNERGFYVADTLRLVLNVGDVQRMMPELLADPNSHLKDRVLYQGEVYVPTRVLPRGSFANRYSVVTIDLNQVNPEELVNFPQFQQYAQPSVRDPRNDYAGYGMNGYGEETYGD